MRWTIAAPLALACFVSACGARGAADPDPGFEPRLALNQVGDTVWYHQETDIVVGMVNAQGDTSIAYGDEDHVLHLTRVAPDTLVAFYHHIRIAMNQGGRIVPVPMETLFGEHFTLVRTDGRYRVTTAPAVPNMAESTREMVRHLDEMFMTVPDQPLEPGLTWGDSIEFVAHTRESRLARYTQTRYRVEGDTIVAGVPGVVIRYESDVDAAVASLHDEELRTELSGTDNGTIVYAPARQLIVSRVRQGRLDGSMYALIQGERRPLPHYYAFDTRIRLIPPGASVRPDPVAPAVAPRAD